MIVLLLPHDKKAVRERITHRQNNSLDKEGIMITHVEIKIAIRSEYISLWSMNHRALKREDPAEASLSNSVDYLVLSPTSRMPFC